MIQTKARPLCMIQITTRPLCMIQITTRPLCMIQITTRPLCMIQITTRPLCMIQITTRPLCMIQTKARPLCTIQITARPLCMIQITARSLYWSSCAGSYSVSSFSLLASVFPCFFWCATTGALKVSMYVSHWSLTPPRSPWWVTVEPFTAHRSAAINFTLAKWPLSSTERLLQISKTNLKTFCGRCHGYIIILLRF